MAKSSQHSEKENVKTVRSTAKKSSPFRWNNYCLIIFVLPFLLYIYSVKNDYNLDDSLVTQNQHLTSQGISAIPEIFKSNYYSDNMGYSYEYRPLVLSSFAIEHQLFGDNPHVSHFINVVLYAFLCFLLYRCLRRFFKNTNYLFSFIIALLFAFHPAHTEVVCSIKNRDELLSMIFGLFAFRYAMLFADGKSYKHLFFMTVCFMLGVLSKKSVLIFGAMIPIFLLVYSGEILATVIIGAILYLCGVMINRGIELHDGGLFFITLPLFFVLYLYLGLRNAESRALLLNPLKDLRKTIALYTHERLEEINPPTVTTSEPDSKALWVLSIANLALFGIFFYYQISLLTLPSLIAIGIFIVARSGNLQTFNLLSNAIIMGLSSYLFIGKPPYLIAVATLGVLYYYNMHGMRRLILISALAIILSYLPKPFAMAWGAMVMMIFVLQTRYKSLWVTIFCASLCVVMNLPFTNKFFGYRYQDDFSFASLRITIIRFGIFALLFGFTLLPRKMKIPYASVIIAVFSLVLLLKMDGVTYRSNERRPVMAQKSIVTEQMRNSRPLTFSEAPVTSQSPLRTRLGTSASITLKYLEKTIVPWPLSFYYGYKCIEPTDIFNIQALLAIVIYTGLLFFAFFILNRSKAIFAGILLFVVGVVAVSGFFFPLPGMMADRFLFVPSLGFAIVFVAGMSLLLKINWTNLTLKPGNLPLGFKYIFVAVLIAYTGLTFARTLDWKDKLTLFRHDIKYVDQSSQAQNLLATNLVIYSFDVLDADSQRVLRREALVHFKKAMSIYPGYMNVPYDCGRTYALLNEEDSALAYYKIAHDITDTFSYVNINIGNILMSKGRFTEAVPYFNQAIKYDPGNKIPYSQMSLALFNLTRYRESLNVTERFIKQFPAIPDPYVNAGRTFEAMGEKDSALEYYNHALVLSNGNMQILSLIDHLKQKKQ